MDKIFGWVTLIFSCAFIYLLVKAPFIIELAFPLIAGFLSFDPLRIYWLTTLYWISPVMAVFGGLLILSHKLLAGSVITMLAGLGVLVVWWGPIGYVLVPLFLLTGVVALIKYNKESK